MYDASLLNANLFSQFADLDQRFYLDARAGGCPHCGANLHQAHYPRKPRDESVVAVAPESNRRLSLCCGHCRKRLTPFSVRFLGRKVYFGAIVLLACALRSGPRPETWERLSEMFGPSVRTLRRWLAWWRRELPASLFWRVQRALVPGVSAEALPTSLLDVMQGSDEGERVVLALGFLVPVTSSTAPEGLAF